MKRRALLQSSLAGSTLLTAGCMQSVPFLSSKPTESEIFESHRFEGTDLVVTLRESVDIQRIVLYNSATDEEYETIEQPRETIRFPVVFPDRLQTYVGKSLHVKAKTPAGWVRRWIPEMVHGSVETVEVLSDGRAKVEITSQATAPLLVRFVAIYGDVPNPTVNPQSESVDRAMLPFGPGVVGIEQNRPLSPSRTDLVIPSGETASFETTYAPFAFPDGASANDCNTGERTGEIAVVHASGGSASYGFSFRLEGEPTETTVPLAEVCTRSSPTE